MSDSQQVAVIGYGTMGAGIAQVFAHAGHEVTVLETDRQRIDAGDTFVADFLASSVERGKLSADGRDEIRSRISGTTDFGAVADVAFVVESVTERVEVKRSVLGEVAKHVSETTPILTNTSALSVTELATAVSNPQRFAGLHFFNPAPLMPVIEVVRAVQTDQQVLDRVVSFVRSLPGKEAVVVKDRPGFLVNSLLIPYLNDVIQAYDDGLASAADIDTAMKLGLGYKTGPLELLDMLGLDVHLDASDRAFEGTYDVRFAPPPLLRRMVAAGRLGAKSGHGFRTEGN